jgi:hypothetical protein
VSVDRCPGSSPLISSASWSAETAMIRSSISRPNGVGPPVRRADTALDPAARLETIDERHEPARGEPDGKGQLTLRAALGQGHVAEEHHLAWLEADLLPTMLPIDSKDGGSVALSEGMVVAQRAPMSREPRLAIKPSSSPRHSSPALGLQQQSRPRR